MKNKVRTNSVREQKFPFKGTYSCGMGGGIVIFYSFKKIGYVPSLSKTNAVLGLSNSLFYTSTLLMRSLLKTKISFGFFRTFKKPGPEPGGKVR